MANKIIHKHSSVITDKKAKLPNESQLEYGELAVNYAKGVETISLKNSENEIVEIKSTAYIEKIIEDNEFVTASALNQLNERCEDIEEEIKGLDDKFATREHTHEQYVTNETFNSRMEEDERVIATALNQLNEKFTGVQEEIEGLGSTYASKEHTHEQYAEKEHTHEQYAEKTYVDEYFAQKEHTHEQYAEKEHTHDDYVDKETFRQTIEDNEFVTASALNELDSRCKDIQNKVTEFDDKFTTKVYVDESFAQKEHTHEQYAQKQHTHEQYAEKEHTHEQYAEKEHTHEQYAEKEHTHEQYAEKAYVDESFAQKEHTHDDYVDKETFRQTIEDNEFVTASALTNLDTRLTSIEKNGGDSVDLTGYATTESVDAKLSKLEESIASKQNTISDIETIRSNASKGATAVQPDSLATVAATGSYNDLSDKPTIPSAVTESTVSEWGFTKNTGTYSKPGSGIPKSDLSSNVQSSLDKADTALQSVPSEYITESELNAKNYATTAQVNAKQDIISDLSTIRSGAEKGATALQSVPSEYVQITQLSTIATTGSYNDLFNKPTIPNIEGLATEEFVNAKFDEVFQSVSNGKLLIASAITDKGVYASNEDTFQELSDKIDTIIVAPPGENLIGYVDEENDIYLSLSDLNNGTYHLRFEGANGLLSNFDEIGTVIVE